MVLRNPPITRTLNNLVLTQQVGWACFARSFCLASVFALCRSNSLYTPTHLSSICRVFHQLPPAFFSFVDFYPHILATLNFIYVKL